MGDAHISGITLALLGWISFCFVPFDCRWAISAKI
jgi:hypothetical protein